MKTRSLLLALIAGAVIALAVGAVACGGGEELTLEEYFQKLVDIDKQHEAEAQPLRDQLNASLNGLGDEIEVPAGVRDALRSLVASQDNVGKALSDLTPPAEAKDAHKEAAASITAEGEALAKVIGQLDDAKTVGDLNHLFEGDEITKADERRSTACVALQQIATDNAIQADLNC